MAVVNIASSSSKAVFVELSNVGSGIAVDGTTGIIVPRSGIVCYWSVVGRSGVGRSEVRRSGVEVAVGVSCCTNVDNSCIVKSVDLSCIVKCVDLSLLPAVDSRPLYVAGSRNKAEFVELSDVGSAIVVHCRVGCRARVC